MKELLTSILAFIYIGLYAITPPLTTMVTFSYDEAGNRITRVISVDKLKNLEDINHAVLEKFPIIDNPDLDFSFESIIVYPNPVNVFLNIELNISHDNYVNCFIYDINGRLIEHHIIEHTSYRIEMSSYNPGNYILILSYKGNNLHYKIIKQ